MIDKDKDWILSAPKGRTTERFIKKNYPKDYETIITYPGLKFSEKLYNYFYNYPKHICPICGKETPFRNILHGYSEFCSVQCSYKSKSRIEKIEQTCLERYGVKNPSYLDAVKKKREETCLKNHGVRHWMQDIDRFQKIMMEKHGVKNPSYLDAVKKKREETCLKNHGVKCALSLPENKLKAIQATEQKYGVKCSFLNKDVIEKSKNTRKKKFLGTHKLHISYTEDGDWICECPHPECDKCTEKQFIIKQNMFHDRQKYKSELCTKLLPPQQSRSSGTTLELFIQNILNEYNIEYQTNVRDIISPKELDIYIPSKNIAIECNGCYWHSLKEPSYHINKYKDCEEKGIQLLTIWEDWIRNKPEIIKSIFKSKLGLISNKIYARKCEIKEVQSNICKDFLNKNHIQGFSPSTIKLGLYYNNELVSVMTFSKSRVGIGKKEDGWELVRFCNKLNTRVIGGASKLLKYFINKYHPTQIVSYSANDISDGGLYNKLGFIKEHENSPSYWYIHTSTFKRYHRFNFRKAKLKELGFDVENKTESEIMKDLPYWKIFDSGTTRWIIY